MLAPQTSKNLAREARSFALKSIPTKQATPAMKAAKTAACLQKEKYGIFRRHPTVK